MAPFESIIEKILEHFAGPQFLSEVQKAKKEFFDNSGVLDDQADHFELRMSQFLDWYFFTRELSGFGQTPLESSHLVRELRFTAEEKFLIEKLKEHRHSLFEFIKTKDEDVYIKDLLKNEKLIVRSSPWTVGFNSDEIFEARLIPFDNSYFFTKGFCFHPEGAKKYILSEVKRHRKDPDLNPDDLMLKLVKMRYKYERYRHVKLEMIYNNDAKRV